jgi:hypothetical protein
MHFIEQSGLQESGRTEVSGNTLDDIAYLRALADEGRGAAPLGGTLLAAFGWLYGSGALLAWTSIRPITPMWAAPWILGGIVASTVFGLFMVRPAARLGAALVPTAAALGAGAVVAIVPQFIENGPASDMSQMQLIVSGVIGLGLPLLCAAVFALSILFYRGRPASHSLANSMAGAVWIGAALTFMVIVCSFIIWGTQSNRFSDNWAMMRAIPGVFWALWGISWWAAGAAAKRTWMFGVAAGSWGWRSIMRPPRTCSSARRSGSTPSRWRRDFIF